MGSNELGGVSMEALVGALVELDRDLAADLREAVGRYTRDEMHRMTSAASNGDDVTRRVSRIGRLEIMRHTLERELNP